jgi:hypothetical protein
MNLTGIHQSRKVPIDLLSDGCICVIPPAAGYEWAFGSDAEPLYAESITAAWWMLSKATGIYSRPSRRLDFEPWERSPGPTTARMREAAR